MPGTLNDKIALVTGAGSGIGRATSLVLAREGATIVVSDVNADGGEETLSAIKDMGGDGMFVHADVSRAADVEALVGAVVNAYGRLYIAYNNAGIEGFTGGRLHEYPEDTWDRIIDINVKGVWLCLKYEIPQMLKQGGGAIVNTASAAGLVGSRQLSAYSASKHAVVALTETVNMEEAANGIRACAICPAEVATPIMDKRPIPPSAEDRERMLQAEDLGATIRFVAELPPRACINQLIISPTWNRMYVGGLEVPKN